MHGFPLKFGRIGKQMHKGKMQFATERAAKKFNAGLVFVPLSVLLHVPLIESQANTAL